MRLWSLHPSLLDRAALVAGWREALLAQKVLAGGTRGYTNHPQLHRFRAHPDPMVAIGAYLSALQEEATDRGYRFDATRILRPPSAGTRSRPVEVIPVTSGQLEYELEHLRRKVTARAPEHLPHLPTVGTTPRAHPLMRVGPGDVEDWEVR
ncbi:pyrimidine dimer DNA glycosylase/endonuclease V [Brachybacterium epidermidis]|uniref:pyrimidine dimer DNA glycosylase/endonuclease V n=1 Tax=Brachybacterium epidermidis TaxID=2781983 RepID=UPI00398F4B65